MKRLSQPSRVASILEWKKTAYTVLAVNFHRNRVGIAVAPHPSRGLPCRELEPLRFDTDTTEKGNVNINTNNSETKPNHRHRSNNTIAGAIDRDCLDRFSKIVEEHKVSRAEAEKAGPRRWP